MKITSQITKVILLLLFMLIALSTSFYNHVLVEGLTIDTGDLMKVPEAIKLDDTVVSTETTCPPCPPCARCPEPSFECKKVPTYSNIQRMQHIPNIGSDNYTTFGM